MKPINEMSLAELAELYDRYYIADDISARLRELHELTRWIPVEERLPTEADFGMSGRLWVYINGLVTDACIAGGTIHVWDDEAFNSGWSEYNKSDYRTAFTHWKRIDTP